MKKLTREDLMSLEQYSQQRPEFRKKVIEHKKTRQVRIGEHATLYFEDELTIRYQIQEMLRIERVFEPEGIQDELDAYNPLLPDGDNWKATFMLEYGDVEDRRQALAKMIGIEDKVWVRVADMDKVYAIADEDLDRENEEKTSSVHFVRFQLTPEMISAAKDGANISMGIDHPAYDMRVDGLPEPIRASLVADLA